jgi:hypothetical protein
VKVCIPVGPLALEPPSPVDCAIGIESTHILEWAEPNSLTKPITISSQSVANKG